MAPEQSIHQARDQLPPATPASAAPRRQRRAAGMTGRRIRKVSLDSTLSGRPELHCEAHVSSPSPSQPSVGEDSSDTPKTQISLGCASGGAAPCQESWGYWLG